jgi:hypothetical protein
VPLPQENSQKPPFLCNITISNSNEAFMCWTSHSDIQSLF